jgi:REP element-mobilizing transposase RayT
MRYDPERHHRRSVRLRQYDYSQAGAYFVTICVQGRECLLGEVAGAAVVLSPFGRMVENWWNDLPRRFPRLDLDAWVVMPNHLHGIVVLGAPALETTNSEPLTVEGGETPPLPKERPTVGAGFPRPAPCKDRNHLSQSTNSAAIEAVLRCPTLGQVVAYFKFQSTKSVNQARGTPGGRFWQRNYYDHVIREETSLDRLRNYVVENPLRWELDQLHPDQPSKW